MKQVNLGISKKILVLFLGLMLSVCTFAQTSTVTGRVIDVNGEPIIGVNVSVDGGKMNVITDIDGNFSIKAAPGSFLNISFIGYKSQKVSAESTPMRIVLKDNAVLLQDAIVIGYGTVKKNDLTGSVVAMKPDELNHGLQTNAQDMITGKIAGVSVISDGGTPGGKATIRIRGGSSLNASNDPLVVIDGLAMDNQGIKGVSNLLSTVNPNDIASFTVLKDASATAIYGSRASNGVIIITTKRGVAGAAPKVSYDGNISFGFKRNTVAVMNGDEYENYVETLSGKDSDAYKLLGSQVFGKNYNTNWQDAIFRTAVSHDHNISVSGGFGNIPYRISGGYTNESGTLITSSFERVTGSINLAPTFYDKHLSFNINAKGMYAKNRYADAGAVGAAIAMDPTKPIMVENSSNTAYSDFGGYFQWYSYDSALGKNVINSLASHNPVAMLKQKHDIADSGDFIGNIEADYKFFFCPDLHIHANAGLEYSDGVQRLYESPESYDDSPYGRQGRDHLYKYNKSFNAYAQYSHDFNIHHLDVMGGYEWQHFYRAGLSHYNGVSATHNETSTPTKTESYLVSFFGRLNYSLLDRYMLTTTLRDDGTSRFSKNNRWGLFPSAALAWKIKNEPFMRNIKSLSDLKLRLGYGLTGQQDIDQGDYPYIPQYTVSTTGASYPFGGEYYTTNRPNAYNQNLKWESTTTWNVGVDYGFLHDRITGSVDWYYRTTKDLLNTVSISAETNFNNKLISNVGSLKNYGLEAAIDAKLISKKDFLWDVSYNVTWNKNKITKLTTGTGDGYYVATGSISSGTGETIQAQAVGQSANAFYVYKQIYDTNGKPIAGLYEDRDGDGKITSADKYYYKSPNAPILMGFSNKFVWKEWDFGFTMRASIGNYIYDDVLASHHNVSTTGYYATSGYLTNVMKRALSANFGSTSNIEYSDYYVKNASFLRCDNITLGYTFTNVMSTTFGGRLYATVGNPFVITKYKGLDPEVSGGIDRNVYPRPVTFTIGLNLNF